MAAETLARMDRVLNLGQAALAAPFGGFGDHEIFPAFESKAGVYCARVVTYHPLTDGNKRAGYDVMVEFVERNGRVFTHPPGGLDATAQVIEDLAAGTLTEPEFLAWVTERVS